MCKVSFKEIFFWNDQISKDGAYKFFKFYDNEGDTQLLLQSDHFINSTVWYLIFGQNFITSILVLSFYKCMVMSVPCDIGKRYDTSFKMKFLLIMELIFFHEEKKLRLLR